MASRSPTLRASTTEPQSGFLEKDPEKLQPDGPDAHLEGRRKSSWKQSMQRDVGHEQSDPFGDEEGGDGVKYRTLEWWLVFVRQQP